MPKCEDEDCGDEVKRRVLCFHCGIRVCGWCWKGIHRCEPGHQRADCRDLRAYRRYGKAAILRRRSRTLKRMADDGLLRASFKEWPCEVCMPFIGRALARSDMRCVGCKMSFASRLIAYCQLSRKRDWARAAAGEAAIY